MKTPVKKRICDRCHRKKNHGYNGYEYGWWRFNAYMDEQGKVHEGSYCRKCSDEVMSGVKSQRENVQC